MCTYGIGLPFDHPIWQNLPPCRCGVEQALFPSFWAGDLAMNARWRVVGSDQEVIFESPADDGEPDPTSLLEAAR